MVKVRSRIQPYKPARLEDRRWRRLDSAQIIGELSQMDPKIEEAGSRY